MVCESGRNSSLGSADGRSIVHNPGKKRSAVDELVGKPCRFAPGAVTLCATEILVSEWNRRVTREFFNR
jgi:hypothetical protein